VRQHEEGRLVVFYDVEGNTVTLSTYEGLVRYALT
jgi:hypothetical protein